jgi:hypothetical protein
MSAAGWRTFGEVLSLVRGTAGSIKPGVKRSATPGSRLQSRRGSAPAESIQSYGTADTRANAITSGNDNRLSKIISPQVIPTTQGGFLLTTGTPS